MHFYDNARCLIMNSRNASPTKVLGGALKLD